MMIDLTESELIIIKDTIIINYVNRGIPFPKDLLKKLGFNTKDANKFSSVKKYKFGDGPGGLSGTE